MAIEDEINLKTVLSYASACIETARACHRLSLEGFTFSIIPSRGADPIFRGAQCYYYQFERIIASKAKLHVEITKLHLNSPLSSDLYIPFTADNCDEMECIKSKEVRVFWTRVVKAIIEGNWDSPYYKFYSLTRDSILGLGFRPNIEESISQKNKKFIFIDTVVSGRAIFEIISSFKHEGLNDIHYILIIDKNGSRLTASNRVFLKELETENIATLIYVESLFTEDQGPSVSGIWSNSFPELMGVARDLIPQFKDGAIGCGAYYHKVQVDAAGSNIDYTVGISRLSSIISFAVNFQISASQILDDFDTYKLLTDDFPIDEAINWERHYKDKPSGLEKTLEHQIFRYLEDVVSKKLFDQSNTLAIAKHSLRGKIAEDYKIEVSSSHTIRLHCDKDFAKREIVRIKNEGKF